MHASIVACLHNPGYQSQQTPKVVAEVVIGEKNKKEN